MCKVFQFRLIDTVDFGTAGAALHHDCGTAGASFLC